MSSYGGFSVHDEWINEKNKWAKIDAIAIIVMRFYVIMFIISIIVSIIALFSVNKMANQLEQK